LENQNTDQDRTNIIFVLTDDQGPWAAGCYGNPEIRTPNMDRLAETGIRFDNFFCTSPVCSPSRASFLTGRIPSQHGVHDWIREGNTGPNAADYLRGEIGYTDVLAENGYHCGLTGKWHLGASQVPQHGFSHWFCHEFGGGDYNNAPMIRDGYRYHEKGYITDVITNDALDFLDRSDSPFCLYVGYTAPHGPWTGHPQDIVDSYDDCPFKTCPQEPRHPWAGALSGCLGDREMLKGYFAAVTAMDINLGRIIDKVEDKGLRENTLIVFASDNGFSCGHHGFWGKGNGTQPLNMYENSVKVPFIMSHPGKLEQGHGEDALLSAYDFMPTLLDYVGLPTPTTRNLPGKSFMALLEGKGEAIRDSVVVFDEYGPVRMVRTRDWKYIHRYAEGQPNELYHLADDPDERNNLADNPDCAAQIALMRKQLEEWFETYVEPGFDGRSVGITGEGQMAPLEAWRGRRYSR